MLRAVPTIQDLPFVGSARALLTHDVRFRRRIRRQYPDICRLHIGPYSVVMVGGAELCREALLQTEDFDKTPAVTFSARPAFGEGILLIANGPHRARRRLIQPAFNHSRVESYVTTISEHATAYARKWTDGQILDMGREMTNLTMGVVGKAMFDLDNLGDQDTLGQAITTVFEYMRLAFLMPVPLSWPVPHNIQMRRALALLDETIYSTMEKRRTEGVDRGDFLSMLLAARDDQGRGLSDKEIRDDAMAILVAGHETTAYSLVFAFYLLAHFPRIYARLQDEVHTVLGQRPPTLADLPRLPYTVQVFKETLRLFPAAHTLPRQAAQDAVLDGYQIKKGWFVAMDIWGMHRRPDYFPNPERFDPDRFTPENEAKIHKGAYLPFGSGPRNCIGRHLAMLEGPLVLATITQHARLSLVPGTKLRLKFLLTLRPQDTIRMQVHKD